MSGLWSAAKAACRVESVSEMDPHSSKAILLTVLLALAIAAVVIVLPVLLGVNLWWVIALVAILAAGVRFANWRRRSEDLRLS